MLTAQIINNTLEFLDRPEVTLRVLQGVMGGAIEAAGVVGDPVGDGDLVAYAARDQHGLRPNCRFAGQDIHGPLVLVGVGPHGEHRSLTHRELDAITLTPAIDGALPNLVVTRAPRAD